MSLKKNQKIDKKIRLLAAMAALVFVPLFSGCGSTKGGYKVSLEVWGPFDESIVYADAINQYRKINPYITDIKYRKFSPDTYKQELLDALAAGQGPDIFLINNTWLPSFENKLEPSPSHLVSESALQANFPDVVDSDFVDSGKVYAVPLGMDSLQLYYNKDMFNAAGITGPPKNWQEFSNDVKILTKIDNTGNIIRSGAAIGTAKNVNSSSDLVQALMMQNGLDLPTKKGLEIKFDQGVIGSDGKAVQVGQQALSFYTQFARIGMISGTSGTNPLYTWNSRMRNSVDSFSEGTTAMMFNYYWQYKNIQSKNPKLNFAVASIPQIYPDKPVTLANYWAFAVSKNKVYSTDATQTSATTSQPSNQVRTHEAWQFLKFLTLKNSGTVRLYNAVSKASKDFSVSYDPAVEYLKKSPQPAARRDLIESQKGDANFGPFVLGNLIAKNWYQYNPDMVKTIFTDAVESVVSGDVSAYDVLTLITNRVAASMKTNSY